MATSSFLLSRLHIKGLPPSLTRQGNFSISENLKSPTRRNPSRGLTVRYSTYCFLGTTVTPNTEISLPNLDVLYKSLISSGTPQDLQTEIAEKAHAAVSEYMQSLVLGDLDPATAKLAIGILGPFLSAFAFLFVVRIVMSWYPKLPVGKFPYVIAYAPTEPILSPTRKLISPVGGVDVTPVVWFALISFLNEILLGPQGLLVLLSQKV